MNKKIKSGLTGAALIGLLAVGFSIPVPEVVAADEARNDHVVLYMNDTIKRVAVELASPEMRQIVADTEKELRDTAAAYDTTFEYERDILVCEQVYVPLEDPSVGTYFEDPTAVALSECINATIASHEMIEPASAE